MKQNWSTLPNSNNTGTRTLIIEVPISANAQIFNFPDQPVLKDKKIIGIEAWCNIGGSVSAPAGFYPIPNGVLSGTAAWTYTDMCNAFVQFNDKSNTAIMDREPVPVFNPASNYGVIREFRIPMINVVWTQCKLYFNGSYTPSGSKVAIFVARYVP